MGNFSESCSELKIPLIVLLPRKPHYNRGIEQANKTFKEELYGLPSLLQNSIGILRFDSKRALDKYNAYRPHFALHGDTHPGYIHSILRGHLQSHSLLIYTNGTIHLQIDYKI